MGANVGCIGLEPFMFGLERQLGKVAVDSVLSEKA